MKTDSDPDPVEPPRLCHEVDGVRYALRCKIDPEAGPDDLLVRCLSALGLACTRASDLRAWGSYWRTRAVETDRKRAEDFGIWVPGRSLRGDVQVVIATAFVVWVEREDLFPALLFLSIALSFAVGIAGLKTTFSGSWSPGRLFRGALERVLRLRRNP